MVCTSIAIALQYILLVYLTLMLVGGIQVALMVILVFYRSFVRWLLAACWGKFSRVQKYMFYITKEHVL